MPRSSLGIFLLGVFFVFSIIGSAGNVIQMGSQPTSRFVLRIALFGIFAVVYAVAGIRLQRKFWMALFPLLFVQILLIRWLFPFGPTPTHMDAAQIAMFQGRLVLGGNTIAAGVILGYVCFLYVVTSEGRRYFGVHAELALAAEIHRVLVPPIDVEIGDFEFYGHSVPSSEVGGDLIDVMRSEDGWIAYVADVSGHGVAPGVVTGMVKSAARMQLSSSEGTDALLERLNSVLQPIMKPEMFVTFGYVAWNGARLEYSLAGHPAILHYHAATNEISQITCSNLPLGMFDRKQFLSATVHCAPGDLFVLLTDGLLEVTNARDDEFGLDGITAVLARHATTPVSAIFQAVMEAVAHHGHATDDQSLLLVRCQVHSSELN